MERNSLNRILKIPSHQEQMILLSCMNEKTYLHVSLKEFLKLFKCLASSGSPFYILLVPSSRCIPKIGNPFSNVLLIGGRQVERSSNALSSLYMSKRVMYLLRGQRITSVLDSMRIFFIPIGPNPRYAHLDHN